MVLFVLGFGFLLVFTVTIILGSLPGRIAKKRNHPQAKAIRACGWASIFAGPPMWIIVLMWAYRTHQNMPDKLEARIAALEEKHKP